MIFNSVLSAQNFCGHESYFNSMIQTYDGFIQFINNESEDIQEMAEYAKLNNIQLDVDIPVVVHIVHENEAVGTGNNFDYDDVEDAIDRLNLDFTNTGIQFCKAERDEAGNALIEPGVVRVDASSISEYSNTAISQGSQLEYDIKTLGPQFSNYLYLNIWTVKNIVGANSSGQVQGYGSFPNMVSNEVDGVTMRSSIFTLTTNRVLTHEVGHYLSLYHTFQGDDADFDGTPDQCSKSTGDFPFSDEISDTEHHQRSASGTCPNPTDINPCCTSEDPCNYGTSGLLIDIANNHMDYSSESCRVNFTSGQIDRMQATLMEKREGLMLSQGCALPCNPVFAIDFTVSPENPVAPDDQGINGEDGIFTATQTGYAFDWYIDGESVGSGSVLTNTFNSPGYYDVCLVSRDINGCENIACEEILVYDGGLCYNPTLEPCELVLNGNLSQNNYQSNGSYQFQPDFIELPNVCNWNYYHWTPDFIYNSENIGSIFLLSVDASNGVIGNEAVVTDREINLINGVTYEVSIDYIAFKNINDPYLKPTIYLGLGLDNQEIIPSTTIDFTQFHPILEYNVENYDFILTEPSEQVNFASSILHTIKTTFTYDNSYGKYLILSNSTQIGSGNSYLMVDNISIKECNFCAAQPIFTYQETACNEFNFSGYDENSPNDPGGIISWSIDGVTMPQLTGLETFDFNFPFFGTYEVCMNITCDNNETSSFCQDVTLSSVVNSIHCEVCDGPLVQNVEAQRCDKSNNEFVVESFPVFVPKGYGPCGGNNIFTQSFNGDAFLNDYYIDYSHPTQDLIYLSFTFIADDPSNQMASNFAFCSPDGMSTICFRFNITNPQTCDECIDDQSLVSDIIVICDDNDPTDEVFEYSGSFDISPPNGSSYCGFSSTNSGLGIDQNNIVDNQNGSFTIPFNISTNNNGSFTSSLTICILDDSGDEICFNVRINVTSPCIPDPDGCEIDIPPASIACDEEDNGNAVFNFSYALHLPEYVDDGWEYCDPNPITADGRILFTEQWIGIGAYIFTIRTDIPCNEITQGVQLKLILELCKDGNTICIDLPLNLICDDCTGSKPGNRNVEIRNEVNIFPNPSTGIFYLESSDNYLGSSYYIYNKLGVLVQKDAIKTKTTILNLTDLTYGIYFIKVGDDMFKKIIISK